MRLNKLYGLLLAAGLGGWTATALAEQSLDAGEVRVKGQSLGNGLMVPEESPKARSTVTKEALDKMAPAGNAIDKLKYTPGLNVSSTDSSGLSGFTFTMRGMNSNQVGVSLDGVPVNDSGNYDLYPNLLGDPENLGEIFVTQGSSEIDGAHIGSSGGNIGLVSLRPEKDFGVFAKQSLGSNSLQKTFVRANTGEHYGLSNYLSASHTEADKWKGKGSLRADKFAWNSFFDMGDGNSLNAIINYHQQENYNYLFPSKAEFKEFGRKYDYAEDVVYRTGTVNGVPFQKIASSYQLNRNPFETVTTSLTGRFQLRDDLALTVAPYYYWANGGGANGIYELNRGSSNGGGNYDLSNLNTRNGYLADGTPNSGLYYRPSWAETWRPGVNSKLKWDLSDEHSLDLGYWYERARQRQTRAFVPVTTAGKPADVWADFEDPQQVRDANGQVIQNRNNFTVTPAHKLYAQDTWYATPDLTLIAGLSYQHSERIGEDRGSLASRPKKLSQTYGQWLPNFGASYRLNEDQQLFYNLTRNMRIPPNFVLFETEESANLKPELSWNNELGWRYTLDDMAFSATLFHLSFSDRQVSTRDAAGDSASLNVGTVVNRGLELEWSGLLPHNFNYYSSYSYTEAEQQDPISSRGVALPTAGKQVAGVPENMFNLSLGYDDGRYYGNIVGKYVSRQYGDQTNDESISDYAIADLNLGVHLPVDPGMLKSAALRLSVNNLFDKEYLSGVRSVQLNSVRYGAAAGSSPYYTVGEERTLTLSLEGSF